MDGSPIKAEIRCQGVTYKLVEVNLADGIYRLRKKSLRCPRPEIAS
jgi:hypothetical protein